MAPALLIAFIGGALTILTPCGPMLLPSFFAWSFSSPTAMARRTGQFTVGLLLGAVPMGIVVGGLGIWLRGSIGTLTTVAAILIIGFAVLQFFDITIRFPARKAKVGPVGAQASPGLTTQMSGTNLTAGSDGSSTQLSAPQGRGSSSAIGVVVLGFSYSLAAIGCSGPILGAVLSFSTVFSSTGIASGILSMAFYALGMAFPVVLLAFLWDRFNLGQAKWLKPRPAKVLGRWTTRGNVISGLIMGALGIFLLIFGRAATMPAALSVNQQIDLEKRIIDWSNTIHWGVVSGVIAGILSAAILVSAGLRMLNGPVDDEEASADAAVFAAEDEADGFDLQSDDGFDDDADADDSAYYQGDSPTSSS